MVKIDTNQSQTNQTQNSSDTQTNPNSNQTQTQKSGLLTIIGQLLPLAPFAFEQFTGQKVPQMSGTMAEIQTALIQISANLQSVINSQQNFNQRLINLETKLSEIQTSATNHLTNLTNQFNSLRLTHTREKKQIEYGNTQNNNSSQFEEENQEY